MRHGDIALYESKAVASYIDKTFGGSKLIPEDARGVAEVEQWVSLVNTAVDPCMVRDISLELPVFEGRGRCARPRSDRRRAAGAGSRMVQSAKNLSAFFARHCPWVNRG
jgi:glutathione S-transferase